MSPSGLDSLADAGPPAAPGAPVAPDPQPPTSSAATVTGTAIHDRVCVMGPGCSSVAENRLKNPGARSDHSAAPPSLERHRDQRQRDDAQDEQLDVVADHRHLA